MANIQNLIGMAAFIGKQARFLVEKSDRLADRLQTLQRASAIEEVPGTTKFTIDLCDDSVLIRKLDCTGDVIVRLIDAFDTPLALAQKAAEDAEKIKQQCGKRGRAEEDDDITFVVVQKLNTYK